MPIPALTEWLLSNVAALIPVAKVHSFQKGVKYSLGKDVATLSTGIHFYVPFFQSIEVIDVKQQTHNLLTQSVTTKDGKYVTFSCNMTYRITNARKNFTEVHEFVPSLENYAMMVVADHVARSRFSELVEGRDMIQESVKDEINERARKWGATVDDFAFTDLVQAKPYRLFGDPPKLI
jgi:regulator of protease activity HflC (stomatin/prohibitin superfamily)